MDGQRSISFDDDFARAAARQGLTRTLGVIAGAVLTFMCFAAVFVGSWFLLILFLLLYAVAGWVAVRFGRVEPASFALAIAAPSLLLVLWLFPASAMEAGLLRGLLWPALAVLIALLAWAGGRIATARSGSLKAAQSGREI